MTAAGTQLPQLSDLLALHYPDILERYEKDYPSNTLKGKDAFSEVMKFLWIIRKHDIERKNSGSPDLDFILYLQPEMAEIDDMWHTFILFTQEYQQFCLTHFGSFLHHAPVTNAGKMAMKEKHEEYLQHVEKSLCYVFDHLGEETLRAWFPEEYFKDI